MFKTSVDSVYKDSMIQIVPRHFIKWCGKMWTIVFLMIGSTQILALINNLINNQQIN